jgi:hypothetical protein
MGARIRAQGAREAARKAAREADRAEAEAWSIQMEGYGGPAQPSSTIGQCISGGYGWLEVKKSPLRYAREPAARCNPATPGYADLEAGGRAEMPVLPQRALRSARAHDQTDRVARNHAVQMGSSG